MKNESVKKSLGKSKNVQEEKLKNGQAKNLHKKDQHFYNNCYELRSRAINKGFFKFHKLRLNIPIRRLRANHEMLLSMS